MSLLHKSYSIPKQKEPKQKVPLKWQTYFSLTFFSLLGLLVCLLCLTQNATAKTPNRFKVTKVSASASKGGIDIISNFKLSLSSKAYEAINQGVPIDIILNYAQPKHYFWGIQYKNLDTTIFTLSRHSLSGNYVLKNQTTFRNTQFQTVDDALKQISLFQLKRINNQNTDEIAIRIYLDLFRLPPQIRANAFFSGRWRHDSDWTIWRVS